MRKLEAWGDLLNKHLREETARARPCCGNRRKGRLAGGEARRGVSVSELNGKRDQKSGKDGGR